MDSNILAAIITACFAVAGWVIPKIFAQKSLVYAVNSKAAKEWEQAFDKLKNDVISIKSADSVCRANMDGIDKERIQAIEFDVKSLTTSVLNMHKYTDKLDKRIDTLNISLTELATQTKNMDKDLNVIKADLKQHNILLSNIANLIEIMHADVKERKDTIKKATTQTKTKKSTHFTKEDFQAGKI